MTALTESLNAGIPIIAMIGDTNRTHAWKNMTQETRQVEMLRPAVKEVIRIEVGVVRPRDGQVEHVVEVGWKILELARPEVERDAGHSGRFELLAHNKLPLQETVNLWSSPFLSGERIYMREHGKLFCFR